MAALQSRAVKFAVKVIAVKEVVEPKLDDEFAAKVGPFKTVAELKEDVKKQLQTEKEYQADREFVDKLLTTLGEQSTVAIPPGLLMYSEMSRSGSSASKKSS